MITKYQVSSTVCAVYAISFWIQTDRCSFRYIDEIVGYKHQLFLTYMIILNIIFILITRI